MASVRIKTKRKKPDPRVLEEIYGVVLVAASLLLALFVFSKVAGVVGYYATYFLKYLVGVGRYLIPPFIFAWGIGYLMHRPRIDLESVGIGLLISFISIISLVHLFTLSYLGFPHTEAFDVKFLTVYGGGYIGGTLSYALWFLLRSGAYIILFAALIIGLVLCTGASISKLLTKTMDTLKVGVTVLWQRRRREALPEARSDARETMLLQEAVSEPEDIHRHETRKQGIEKAPEPVFTGKAEQPTQIRQATPSSASKKYQLPPLDILKKTSLPKGLLTKRGTKEGIQVLEKTLRNFEVDAQVTRVMRGPTVTRFEVQLASGVKVNRVLSLADDIALALASPDVRIVTPIPGKSAIGIEVPNRYRELVTLGDVLTSSEARKEKSILTMGLGKDIAGHPVLADLGQMPHILIAGATGSGKSVCVNGIIVSILTRARPDEVKMILIDPKRIEFNLYEDVPHLLTPVVTDPKQAATVLSWAVSEMDNRFKLLSKVGARNIAAYNTKIKQRENEEFQMLPYILIIIDELADLMIVSPGEVEDTICRVAQMARAVGIHLVVSTQRPSADIITGLIKANITSRIAFAVSSQTDSRVILDTGGAEKLVGRGDMLFGDAGALRPRRLQGSFVTEQEVSQVVGFIKAQAEPEYNEEIFEQAKSKLGRMAEDDLLYDAMELVVSTGMASVSMLQRRLRVGYTRAARLIDILEERGIVGGYEGSRPRAVLVTPEEFERIKQSQQQL